MLLLALGGRGASGCCSVGHAGGGVSVFEELREVVGLRRRSGNWPMGEESLYVGLSLPVTRSVCSGDVVPSKNFVHR
jgi:hypothetical protein